MRVGWSNAAGSKFLHFYVGQYSACGKMTYDKFRINASINGNYKHPWQWRWMLENRHSKKKMVICKNCQKLFFDTLDMADDFINEDEDIQSVREVIRTW